jgi:hypothetical protein
VVKACDLLNLQIRQKRKYAAAQQFFSASVRPTFAHLCAQRGVANLLRPTKFG